MTHSKQLLVSALICAASLAALFGMIVPGCEKSVENNSEVLSLREARFEYGGELLASDSSLGIYVNVYRSKSDNGVVVATFRSEDSVVVFAVDEETGELQQVSKPLSSHTKCLMRGVAMCKQFHDPNNPEEAEELASCIANVMMQCGVLSYLFGWLCS